MFLLYQKQRSLLMLKTETLIHLQDRTEGKVKRAQRSQDLVQVWTGPVSVALSRGLTLSTA